MLLVVVAIIFRYLIDITMLFDAGLIYNCHIHTGKNL